jgi:predicted Zn-dependent protease
MKFSRGYEHDADLNGARMMAATGYDPIELANFFEKLKAKLGTAAEPKGLSLWMASHPATGSRIEYVSQDIQFYPKKNYATSTGNFARVKQTVAGLPPAKLKPAALLQAAQDGTARSGIPQGFKDYRAKGFSIAYPGTWQVGQPQQGGSLYLVPPGGAKQSQNGVELLAGAMIDYYVPQKGAASLDGATSEFVESLKKGDAGLKAESLVRAQLGKQAALKTKLTTRTSDQKDQVIYLYTIARDAGLWYLMLAAVPSQLNEFETVFGQMEQSVGFPD